MSEITDKMEEAGYLRQCHEFTENVRDMLGAGYGEGYQLSDLWRILQARDKAFLRYEKAGIAANCKPSIREALEGSIAMRSSTEKFYPVTVLFNDLSSAQKFHGFLADECAAIRALKAEGESR